LLEVKNLQAGYDRLQVLWDVSLSVEQGQFVALIGANGAGKTTTLRSISGVVAPQGGEVLFMGKSLKGMPAHKICQAGISYITEELNLFEAMTVQDNLLLGAYNSPDNKVNRKKMERVFELFPILAQRRTQLAGTLSGGERRMLALGRGMMSGPRLLMVDEPSLGLAPRIVQNVFDALKTLHESGVTILLVEQNVYDTLCIANKAYVLEQGRVVLQGSSTELLDNAYLKETYLGGR
jgi:branched-chain amino acid transport system ATP-binding protein